ncbi:unnamed protein product [Rotaria sp. Silwood1]|nr:unnamed protein product [Rotaria sp. Silwood1]CAF1211732.1 unnamed protein product [Rotaria sp. Silwood1]CAF4839521.1 unnamed protein product [Rotaria sp. Silwood1]
MISMPFTVSIDNTRIIEPTNSDEKYTVYQITVRGGTNHISHTIDRRYREFEALHTRLSSSLSVPQLPRKVLLHRRSTKVIEQRRQLLEIYLNDILRRCQQQSIMPEELGRFLQIPPYDNENELNQNDRQQQEQDLNDDEMKNILEHGPCISISDYCPWNHDNRGKRETMIVMLMVQVDFFLATESARRHRRQYTGYGYVQQQYGSQYGLYSPVGQRWMNNRYLNQQDSNMNNNFNSNKGNQRPEWYYNTAYAIQYSILCFVLCILYSLSV